MNRSLRQAMIDRGHKQLSLVRQCTLLNISRASVYYRPVSTRAEDLELMARMDRQYLKTPFYGSRRMKAWLLAEGYLVSRSKVRRLMRLMGLEAIYRRPNTSKPAPGHRVYPYLLKGVDVNRDSPDQTNFPGNSSFWDTVKYNPAFQGRQMRPDSLKIPVFI